MKSNKTLIGLTEKVTIVNGKHEKTLVARIDTGATQSSIDTTLATELNLGPVISTRLVKSTHGSTLRAVIRADIMIADKKIRARFNLADRHHMRYRILIGRNLLRKQGFLIDPDKKDVL